MTGQLLDATSWERLYGEKFEVWRKSRWVDSSPITRTFLEHLLPLGKVEGEKRFMPHQAEALQRVIYSFEKCDLNPLMTTLATGTGKTVVMAGVMSWLACRGEIANTFILFCPNTIVRDRLKRDFESLSVFKEFNLFPREYQDKLENLSCSVIEKFENFSNLLGKNLIVSNRHQFQKGYKGGNDHLAFLQKEGGNIAVFNDEAHNTRGREYTRTLKILGPQTKFRLDVTATPDRADNLRPQCHEIYHLSVLEAITGSYRANSFVDNPPLVKDVVVQRPSIKTLKAVQLEELIFEDENTRQTFTVREIDWEKWPQKKNLQLVMDPGGMKMQLQLSCDALERKKSLAKDRYRPLLFVIAPSIAGAKKAVEMMKKDFKLNPLLVVDDVDENMEITEKVELRKAAADLGNPESPYDSVVSVYMLREGWDVPEVSVMCLLRGFGSPLFAHQVLGRGLRLIRRNNLGNDRPIQELTVIDHPCLQLDDLWAEIDALVKEGENITREREFSRDEQSELPEETKEIHREQELIRPELKKMLMVPSPQSIDKVTTERVLEILEYSLKEIKEYRLESVIITGGRIEEIKILRPRVTNKTIERVIEVSALPKENSKEREEFQKGLNQMLMKWADDYCEFYEPLVTHNGEVYRTILRGFETHLFSGQTVIEIDIHTLYGAQNIIPQIKEAVSFEMNRHIYQEEVLSRE